MRDLISDDRRSIIDVEDQDIQIDYEQFSKSNTGAPAIISEISLRLLLTYMPAIQVKCCWALHCNRCRLVIVIT